MSRPLVKDPDFDSKLAKYARMYCQNKWTLRKLSRATGISKSSLHQYFKKYLYQVDSVLYEKVIDLMQYNKEMAHIWGGYAFKSKAKK